MKSKIIYIDNNNYVNKQKNKQSQVTLSTSGDRVGRCLIKRACSVTLPEEDGQLLEGVTSGLCRRDAYIGVDREDGRWL